MKPTSRILDLYNTAPVAYAPGDLDGQVGYVKNAASGTRDIFVVATTDIEGDQCLAVRNAAAGANSMYEKAIGVTRVPGTDTWIVEIRVRIKSTATAGDDIWFELTDAAAGVLQPNVTAGLWVGFEHDGGTHVNINMAD